MQYRTRILLCVASVIILLALYLSGVRVQYALNDDSNTTDQGAYMDYAKKLHGSNYTWVGDRNRMPLYPLITSLLYRTEMDRDVLFARGKVFNVALSLLLLAALYPIFRRHLALHLTINLLLITAFLVFIFRAPYYQCELLFYFLNLLGFWLFSRLLVRPNWKLGAAAGLVLALAHLTKASILPGLVLFCGCAVLQALVRLWRSRRGNDVRLHPEQGWTAGILGVAVCLLVFFSVLYPYISNSKRVYGRYFYNVNSTFYIWYDSWSEVKQGTRLHGDRKGWPDMPAEEIPSLSKYLREHTLEQIVQHEWRGAQIVITSAANSYGYFRYAVLYMLVALGCVAARWKTSLHLARAHPFLLLFWALWFSVYFALYAWYTSITRGVRLPLAQFMPLMWSLSLVIARLGAELPAMRIGRLRVPFLSLVNGLITVMVLIEVYSVVTYRIATMTGAS